MGGRRSETRRGVSHTFLREARAHGVVQDGPRWRRWVSLGIELYRESSKGRSACLLAGVVGAGVAGVVVGWAGLPLPAPACRLPACGLGSIPLLFPFLARFVVCGSGDWAREGATGARPEGPKTGTAAVPSGTRDVVFPVLVLGVPGSPGGGWPWNPFGFGGGPLSFWKPGKMP